MSLHSAIYTGSVRHRRFLPRRHVFRYGLFMMYLDLDELDRVFAMSPLWSHCRPAPARFRRSDYLGDASMPLVESVRDRVERVAGFRPEGPVRLLTHVRYFGYCFNPVSFYYCFEPGGERVSAVLAEITNTPWRERHTYVLDGRGRPAGAPIAQRFGKQFHVSPFMPMDMTYDWRIEPPEERLSVQMTNRRGDDVIFDATLQMRRRAMSGRALNACLLRHPFMTLEVIGAIHWQALKLKLKGVPFHPHPARAREVSST
jgi:DUF1365 family protein